MRTLFLPAIAAASLAYASVAAPAAPGDLTAQPTVLVVRDVVLDDSDDAAHYDLRVEAGRITQITLTSEGPLAGARIYEGEGRLAMPAFIDTWSYTGCATPSPQATQDRPIAVIDDVRAAMRTANRKGIQPSFRAVDVLDFGEAGAEAHRTAGFGTLLSVPSGELIAGRGALCATGDSHLRDLVITSEVFQNGAFAASGRGYPSTLMGYFAQLRQFFYDVERHEVLQARRDAGKSDPRAAWDPELEAGLRVASGRELFVVRTQTATDVERWMRLADEFNLRIAIAGGRDAWRHADALAARKIPVFLDLDWGKEYEDPVGDDDDEDGGDEDEPEMGAEESGDAAPEVALIEEGLAADGDAETAEDSDESSDKEEGADDEAEEEVEEASWKYTEPLPLRIERRRLWEERRDNAIRLQEAGVQVYFGTGKGKASDLLGNLRKLVEAGLPRDYATAALTTDAARLLGVSSQLGQIAEGSAATFCLWTEDPLNEDAQLALIAVDGGISEFEVKEKGAESGAPDEGVDVTGPWKFAADDDEGMGEASLELTMTEDGKVTGTMTMESPMDGAALSAKVKGSVTGKTLAMTCSIDMGGMSIDMEFEGEIEGVTFDGTNTVSGPWGEETSDVTGTHTPEHRHGALNWGYEELFEEHYSCH